MKFNYHIIILLLLIVRLFTPSTAKATSTTYIPPTMMNLKL